MSDKLDEPVANPCGTCGRDAKKDWLLCREHFVRDLAQLKARVAELEENDDSMHVATFKARSEMEAVLIELEAKTAQAEHLRTAMKRILRLAADGTTRPWRLREDVAGISAGAIAATALDSTTEPDCHHGRLVPCMGKCYPESRCPSCGRCYCDVFAGEPEPKNGHRDEDTKS